MKLPFGGNTGRPGYRPGPPRRGNRPIHPSTIWIQEKLADRQWHDYEQLAQELVDSGVKLPNHHNAKALSSRNPRLSMAKQTILGIIRRGGYDKETKEGSTRVSRVRMAPDRNPYGSLVTCSRCGRPNLSIRNRVRRTVGYKVPTKSTQQVVGSKMHGSNDRSVAHLGSEYLCISCADQEIQAKGANWTSTALPEWLIEQLPEQTQRVVLETLGLVSSNGQSREGVNDDGSTQQ